MKSHIPLLLYVVSLGLSGHAAWTVYETLSLWKDSERRAATERGQEQAHDCLARSKGLAHGGWVYRSSDRWWWEALTRVNLVGKLLPPPKPPKGTEGNPVPPVEVRPLEEIIELVSLVHDGEAKGRGGDTHVIVRYKPAADVKVPQSYLWANMIASAAVGERIVASEVTRARPGGSGSRRQGHGNSVIPTSMVGREILQKVWVRDDGDARHGSHLWPPFDKIKLVGVSPNAQVAYFVRDLPPLKGDEALPEPEEESLLKTNMHVSAELLEELKRLQGRAPTKAADAGPAVEAANPVVWIDVPETTVVNGVRQISKKDEERFRNPDELLSQIHFDTYVSSSGKVTGLIVRNVDAKVAATFGVAAGEVLLEINGRPVRSRMQAMEIGKNDYKRGVRTFITKWMANGAVIERTFQAPDR